MLIDVKEVGRGADYRTAGQDGMKIPVIFVNGQVGHIHRHTLDYLIGEKEIVAFHRSEGWVQLGVIPYGAPSVHHQNRTQAGRLPIPENRAL